MTTSNRGDTLTAISDGVVAILKEFYGRGPTEAKTYYDDDLVVCLVRGGFSPVERRLIEGARAEMVMEQRTALQELLRPRLEELVERATGRRVVGFVSGNQYDPELSSEVFLLADVDGAPPAAR